MDRDDVYECWAPTGARWTNWVKPVLFAFLPDDPGDGRAPARLRLTTTAVVPPSAPDAGGPHPYRDPAGMIDDLAIVVDLPGGESVAAGLALAELGFCPVPLYNALPGADRRASLTDHYLTSLVDVEPVVAALIACAQPLRARALSPSAPPAFLLDANRMRPHLRVEPGRFDNRSLCAWADFPSAELLGRAGIRRVLLIKSEPGDAEPDVAAVLRRWRAGGLELFAQTRAAVGPPEPFSAELSWLRRARLWFSRAQLYDLSRGQGWGRWVAAG